MKRFFEFYEKFIIAGDEHDDDGTIISLNYKYLFK